MFQKGITHGLRMFEDFLQYWGIPCTLHGLLRVFLKIVHVKPRNDSSGRALLSLVTMMTKNMSEYISLSYLPPPTGLEKICILDFRPLSIPECCIFLKGLWNINLIPFEEFECILLHLHRNMDTNFNSLKNYWRKKAPSKSTSPDTLKYCNFPCACIKYDGYLS